MFDFMSAFLPWDKFIFLKFDANWKIDYLMNKQGQFLGYDTANALQNLGTIAFYLLYYLVKFFFLGIFAIIVTFAKIEKGKKIAKRLAKPMFFRDILGVSIETYL